LPGGAATSRGSRLTIAWPHRWEYDKRPELFLAALHQLASAGCDFGLVMLGESSFGDKDTAAERSHHRTLSRSWFADQRAQLDAGGR
jgi:hypothetical protein